MKMTTYAIVGLALAGLIVLAGLAAAQTTAPAADPTMGIVPSLKVQLGSISTIVALTLLLTQVAKVKLAAVPALSGVPIWAYAVGIALALTAVARYAIGCLAGDFLDLAWQAAVAAFMAVGGFSVLKQPGATPANSAGGGPQVSGGRTFCMLVLMAGLAGLLAGGAGCAWKASESVTGAQRTLTVQRTDANSQVVQMTENGQSINVSKIRLSNTPKGGQALTIGTLSETDTVAEQQGQVAVVQQNAYAQGTRDGLQLVAALMGKSFTPTGTAGNAVWTPSAGQAAPGGQDLSGTAAGANVASMLAACQTAEEQQTVLRVLGLLPKAKAPAVAAKASKAKAKAKAATTQPATQPAGK